MPEAKTDAQIREEKVEAAKQATKPASPSNTKMVAALLRERAGLEAQGKADRIEQVDEQLKHYGHAPEGAKSDDGKDGNVAARKQAPQGRSSKPQQTGD